MLKKLLLYSTFLLASVTANAADSLRSHAIIYPELTPPFNQVVDLAISGIQDVIPDAEAHRYKNSIVSGVRPILLTNRTRREYQSVFPDESEYVVGLAELRISEPIYGVSFFIAPKIYIDQILDVSDQIEKIVFFYNDARSDAPVLDDISLPDNTVLESISANNTKDALRVFADANDSASPKTAFVFTRGFVEINANSLLDFILRESWDTGVVTVGNKASYVKAGMTLAVIPDFKSYGNQIAKLLQRAQDEDFMSPNVEYLQADINAINVRSALRSNIFANEFVKRRFSYSYPVK